MQITVLQLHWYRQMNMNVIPSDTVRDLKNRIGDIWNISKTDQEIMYDVVLKDDQTLGACGIHNGSILSTTIKLPKEH